MNGAEAGAAEVPQKAFESITKTLTKCKEIASYLSTRSEKLVSLYTGENEPQKEKGGEDVEVNVDSIVLTHVLQDIEKELCQSLSEISDNLDKLEKAW